MSPPPGSASGPIISVDRLTKHYRVHRRGPGLGAALSSLFHREYETKRAVEDLSMAIEAGERVGFLGPNGAGKTTTLKVLAGLLHPTSGRVLVAGHVPQRRETRFLQKITLVMGQKQQLLWDLPPIDTFQLNRAVYDVPRAEFDETMAELDRLLDLSPVWRVPTRQLSLGERMKCELAAALLHRPRVLFLDEPTIGLDVSMQETLRRFVKEYNERFGATVLLTSHYMDDVAALCPRVVVIDKGRLRYDGDLPALVRSIRPDKRVSLRLSAEIGEAGEAGAGRGLREELARVGQVVSSDGTAAVVQVPQAQLKAAVAHLLERLPILDLTIEDPPLEEVMRDMFAERGGAAYMAGLMQGLRAYPTLLRIGLAEAVAYRAEMIVWMLTTTMPLVSMALWSTVARDRRIGPEGFSSGDFVAYFLLTLIVRLLTGSWVLWEMNQEIRTGRMSQRLLRPVHPLLAYSAENLAAMPLRAALVLPLSLILLFLYGRARLTTDPFLILAFFASLPGAWALSFLSMVLCGALAFYIESSMALFQVWMGTYMILSGYLVPLSLLPGALRDAAEVLPFRYMLDFPVRLLLGLPGAGAAAHKQALVHLLIEYGYVAGLLAGVAVLWRAGLRRYSAFGA